MLRRRLIYLLIALLVLSLVSGCTKANDIEEETSAAVEETAEKAEETTDTIAEETEETNEPVSETASDEMIANGDFSSAYESWGIYTEGTICELAPADGFALIPIESTGRVEWAVQLYQDGVQLSKDCQYKIKFDMKADSARTATVRVQKNGAPYTGYLDQNIEVTDTLASYEFDFTMEYDTDPTCRLVFNLGNFEGDEIGAHNVEIDNVSLMLTAGEPVSFDMGGVEINNIRTNQLGYHPNDKKIAVFGDVVSIFKEFRVVSESGDVVYTGEIGKATQYSIGGETSRIGDFSEVTAEGIYHIEVDNYDNSYSFEISENIYNDLSLAVNKMFYYQRCSMELTEELAGDFAHGACHTHEARVYNSDEMIDVSGGWHDAGDFGRYVTPAAKSVIDLILAYENNPAIYTDNTAIPEAGNSTPDILDEVKYELDFLLKMQDPTTGGVYHKVTTAAFTGVDMPDNSTEELILSPISAVATADFAAVMAKAYTIAMDIDEDYAEICLNSALKAWAWLEENPNEHSFSNPPEITTGEYGDSNSNDERFWAACELYNATNNDKYHDFIKNSDVSTGLGWQDVGMYGVISYLKIPADNQDSATYDKLLNILIQEADKKLETSQNDMYSISLQKNDYVWGSNMHVADNAMLMLIANDYNPNDAYVDAAFEHLNYLLGKNPMGISYITGFGENSAQHPHHRITQTVGDVFDGLVIGGPNQNLEDPYAQTMLSDQAPARCYADSDQSYSTNEITIYWNSPVVYLIDYFK